MIPAAVSEIARRSIPATEHIDLRWRTGSFTLMAVTGHWGNARARHSTPPCRNNTDTVWSLFYMPSAYLFLAVLCYSYTLWFEITPKLVGTSMNKRVLLQIIGYFNHHSNTYWYQVRQVKRVLLKLTPHCLHFVQSPSIPAARGVAARQ